MMKIRLNTAFEAKIFSLFLSFGFFYTFSLSINAQNKPCPIVSNTLQFKGSPLEQAKCLLRPNKPRGVLDVELKKLPKPLENLIGSKVKFEINKLHNYLRINNLDETKLGGSLTSPLSKVKLPTGEEIQTIYFVIHDTSTPNYGTENIPPDINTKNWKYNNLEMWVNNPVAHIFVNRLGESITTTPFVETVKKGWGTKFARDFLKIDGKGLQIHIELCQPRQSNPSWFAGNDELAPEVGFTDQQYKTLALLYTIASLRRGDWMIPAYHSAIDAGIKDAHDDPQNFELEKFAQSLQKLIKSIK